MTGYQVGKPVTKVSLSTEMTIECECDVDKSGRVVFTNEIYEFYVFLMFCGPNQEDSRIDLS